MKRYCKLVFAIFYGTTSSFAYAGDVLTLKCAMESEKSPEKNEVWVVIDPANYSMAYNGKRREMQITTDRYSSTEKIGSFVYVYSLNRETGEMVVVTQYEHETTSRKGLCEKAVPPPTNF